MLKSKLKRNLDSKLINWALDNLEKNIDSSDFLYSHSLRTALILKEMKATEETISVGILHHIPMEKIFPENEEILKMIQKLKQLQNILALKNTLKQKTLKKWQKTPSDSQAENLRKMFFAFTQDLRLVFVALACSLDEMRNIRQFPQKQRQQKSLEALEIFAPLSSSLGALAIKGQLEDAAFPYLYEKEYKWLLKEVHQAYQEREQQLEEIKPRVKEKLEKENIELINIHHRAKHYFSLYKKLLKHDMDMNKIYDLVALRIIVPDIESCYKTLGIIHKTWKPLPGRIKDYIASPKRNGYRALHTTVDYKEPLEIQIKTQNMHREAEYGAAAHFSYKTKAPKSYWINKLRKWREEIKDTEKISELLQSEMFKDRIFVFTPKRDIIDLPKDSTAIDFAYAIHTDIGDHCEGARVNNKMISLKKSLKTGQVVDIITNKKKHPSSDWLRFVKTNKARDKVRIFLEKSQGITLPKKEKKISLKKIPLLEKILPKKKHSPRVFVGGQIGISVKFSKCCSPEKGDEIEAFITRGKGASLHRQDCKNLQILKQKWPHNIVKATWEKD